MYKTYKKATYLIGGFFMKSHAKNVYSYFEWMKEEKVSGILSINRGMRAGVSPDGPCRSGLGDCS